jgi:hypothetical protein
VTASCGNTSPLSSGETKVPYNLQLEIHAKRSSLAAFHLLKLHNTVNTSDYIPKKWQDNS